MHKTFGAVIGVAGLALAAQAQSNNTYSFVFPGGNVFSGTPLQFEIWVNFDPAAYAFAGAALNIASDDALSSGISNGDNKLKGPGTSAGSAAGTGWVGLVDGQLHFPLAGIFANTANPIQIFSGEWSTGDLTPRVVTLSTQSSKFSLYTDSLGNSASFLSLLVEGMGQIEVVPAPASLALLGLGGLVAGRRRR